MNAGPPGEVRLIAAGQAKVLMLIVDSGGLLVERRLRAQDTLFSDHAVERA